MTTCLSRDGFDEESGKTQLAQQLERLLQRYLQNHFPAPPYSSSPTPFARTIAFMQRLAASAVTGDFSTEMIKLLGSQPADKTAFELIRDLADVFCESAVELESELLKKSTQEALLMSIDVEAGCSVTEFRDLL